MIDEPERLTKLTGVQLGDMISRALLARAAVRHATDRLYALGRGDEYRDLIDSLAGLRAHLDVRVDRLCSYSDHRVVDAAKALVPTGPQDLETHVCALLLQSLQVLADLSDAVEDYTGVVPVDGEFRFSEGVRASDSRDVAGAYVRACELLGGEPVVDDI